MDAFYASVEQLDNPDLKGKPIVVGGNSERGVIAAASYEARKFGVRSAMPSITAKKLCPNLIFVKHRFYRYKEISKQVHEIFQNYTDLIEPLSLDEAFLDVTINKKNITSATKVAYEIRKDILNKTGLTASAGISINKFLAKTASDINKPNGQKTILPEDIKTFLLDLPIQNFFGIGKVTATKMYNLGIFNGKDLKEKSKEELHKNFGKAGLNYYNIVRGKSSDEVIKNRIRKSIGAETTFNSNIASEIHLKEKIIKLCEEVHKRLENSQIKGKTVTLKIKYRDFSVATRSRTYQNYISKKEEIIKISEALLFQEKLKDSVRLVGVSLSNLNTEPSKNIVIQLKLDL